MDPALVAHFYGTKHRLFVEAVELPFAPEQVLPVVFAGERTAIGRRLADFVVTALENEEARRRITGLVRAAASEPEAARLVRELVGREVFARIAEALGVGDADVRAALIGSQVVGLVMARYIVAVDALATMSPEAVAAAIAPTLQRYLTEPLTDEAGSP